MKNQGGKRDLGYLLLLASVVVSLFAITTLAQNSITENGNFVNGSFMSTPLENNKGHENMIPNANEILNVVGNRVNITANLSTNYPVESYTFLISKDSPTSSPISEAKRPISREMLDRRIRDIKKSWIYPLMNDKQPGPLAPGDYYAHMKFNSSQGTLDAGVYERFTVLDYANLTVVKFNDYNNNGVKDADELVLSSWNIAINESRDDSNKNRKLHNYPKDTNRYGQANFDFIPAGTYDVTEEMKGSNWVATNPKAGKAVNVVPFAEKIVYIGNKLKNGTINLSKFYDYNGNNIKDDNPNEPWIPNWPFVVKGGPRGDTFYDRTNSSGEIILNVSTAEPTATYTVTDDLPSDLPSDIWEMQSDRPVSLVPGQNWPSNAPDGYFGNRLKPAHVTFSKFRDDNRNGTWDSAERRLPWGFTVEYNGHKENVSIDSIDSTGRYTEEILFPMPSPLSATPQIKVTITEDISGGCWKPTTSIQRTVTVTPGQNIEVDPFGNYLDQWILIYKYNDTNANGRRDDGERGIKEWPFQIRAKGDNRDIPLIYTDQNGLIKYPARPDTEYIITEGIWPHWRSTTPNPQYVRTDSLTCNFSVYFLNYKEPKIHVHKFNDENGNGVRDPGETSIPSWPFSITGPLNAPGNTTLTEITDKSGSIEHYCPAPGRYRIEEGNMSCWINTTQSIVDVSLLSGEENTMEFGNRKIDSCPDPTDANMFPPTNENEDITVTKTISPSRIDTSMRDANHDTCTNNRTWINYTISICPKRKVAPTDLVIAVNRMVPLDQGNQRSDEIISDGIVGFLDRMNGQNSSKQRIGLMRFNGIHPDQIMPTTDYQTLINATQEPFSPSNAPSGFANYTIGIADAFYAASAPNTSKIIVLVTDGNESVIRPTAKSSGNYRIYSIVVGNAKSPAFGLMNNLSAANGGKAFAASDKNEVMDYLSRISSSVTAPTVMKNVELVDTLPNYIFDAMPIHNSWHNITKNDDGHGWSTRTARWKIGDLSSSGGCWSTSFRAAFCWYLPADAQQFEGKPRLASEVTYTKEDGTQGKVLVPEGIIQITPAPTNPSVTGWPSWWPLLLVLILAVVIAAAYLARKK